MPDVRLDQWYSSMPLETRQKSRAAQTKQDLEETHTATRHFFSTSALSLTFPWTSSHGVSSTPSSKSESKPQTTDLVYMSQPQFLVSAFPTNTTKTAAYAAVDAINASLLAAVKTAMKAPNPNTHTLVIVKHAAREV